MASRLHRCLLLACALACAIGLPIAVPIANAGDALKALLGEILEDAMVSRADVEMAAATYLVYYDAHIAREEDDVIARAGRVLTAEDWAAVKDAVPPVRDPVFGDAPEERYRKLRRQIALEA